MFPMAFKMQKREGEDGNIRYYYWSSDSRSFLSYVFLLLMCKLDNDMPLSNDLGHWPVADREGWI